MRSGGRMGTMSGQGPQWLPVHQEALLGPLVDKKGSSPHKRCCWGTTTSQSVREGCVRCSEYHIPSRVWRQETSHRKIQDTGNMQILICLWCLTWDVLSAWSKSTLFSNLKNVQKGKPTSGVATRHNIFDAWNTLKCIIKLNIFST